MATKEAVPPSEPRSGPPRPGPAPTSEGQVAQKLRSEVEAAKQATTGGPGKLQLSYGGKGELALTYTDAGIAVAAGVGGSTAGLQAPSASTQWQELKNDDEVKSFNGDGRIPLGKLDFNIPPDAKCAIAIIGAGSYSPPTNFHFRIMEDARDTLREQGVHVIGGFMSPVHIGYGKKSLAANYHRVNMVSSALQHSDWVSVDAWECAQDGWTETAKVIERYQKELDQLRKDRNISVPIKACLLGGADLVESFPAKKDDGTDVWTPVDVEMIVSCGVVCIARHGFNLDDIVAKNEILTRHKQNIYVVIPPVENNVSSTLIRKSLAAGKSVKYVVHDAIIEYISKHNLAKLPNWQ